jgi:hypothetical protein
MAGARTSTKNCWTVTLKLGHEVACSRGAHRPGGGTGEGELSHESFSREYAVQASGERQFGLVVGGLLVLIVIVRAYLKDEFGWISGLFVAIGCALIVLGLLRPVWLAPLNRWWQRLGLVLHKVTNPLFLGLIYFVAFVPVGWLMRLFGKDMLSRSKTQWIQRDRPCSDSTTIKQVF